MPAIEKDTSDSKEKISDLIESSNFISKQNTDITSDVKNIRHELHEISTGQASRMTSLEINQGRFKSKLARVESKSLSSDTQHRRLNLIFEGVAEKVSENTKLEIVSLLRKSDLPCPPTAEQISTAFRLGKHNEGTNRPILVCFKDPQVKETVLRNAPSIKKSLDIKSLWINRDHPDVTRRQIANTRRCYNLMKANGYQCRMQGTSITFNDKVYHYKDLNNLPAGSRLEDTRLIPCNEGKGICFSGDLCYMSNLFAASFTYKSRPFLSAEQAFQWEKALHLGNHSSALQIIESDDPYDIMRTGDLIESNDSWRSIEVETLRKINIEKFSQNAHLKERLVKSDYEQFYECTTSTKWGTGVTITSREIDSSTFIGENKFGKLLADIRIQLQGQTNPITSDN